MPAAGARAAGSAAPVRHAADRTAPSRACGAWPTTSASAARLVGLDLLLELALLLLRVDDRELRLLVVEPRDRVPFADVELCALDVVAGLHRRGRVLFLRDAGLRLGLLDFRVRLLQLRLLLLNRALQRRGIELHHHVAGLHHRAVLRELEDLQFARLHRRRQHDRFQRTDLAADLERVDELALA